MKRFSILFVLTVLLAVGCSTEEPSLTLPGTEETPVEVGFRLEPVETDASLEPMTRATDHKVRFFNECRVLILKKADTRWIVDDTRTVLLDPKSDSTAQLKLSAMPPSAFSFELRPGAYRAVAVINWQRCVWNKELVPGKVVADASKAWQRTPSLVVYPISTHWMNKGYWQLSLEVFVAVADFTVPKSSDLHDTGVPAVSLRAERRVAKFRVLLKDKFSPVEHFSFDETPHTVRLLFRAKEGRFAEGIDALGGMFYSDPSVTEMPWCVSTVGRFHVSGTERYQLCQTNSTVFSPFLFADPSVGELPIEVEVVRITGAADNYGFSYHTSEVFPRTLATSRISGIVFETTDTYEYVSQRDVEIVEAKNAQGEPENAATIFDAFYEWNAESY